VLVIYREWWLITIGIKLETTPAAIQSTKVVLFGVVGTAAVVYEPQLLGGDKLLGKTEVGSPAWGSQAWGTPLLLDCGSVAVLLLGMAV